MSSYFSSIHVAGIQLPASNIVSCVIRIRSYLNILPRIELVYNDNGNNFELSTPNDGTVSVELSDSELNDTVKYVFDIVDFIIDKDPSDKKLSKIKISGKLSIDNIDVISTSAFSSCTSVNAIKTLCSNLDIKTEISNASVNDNMTWIQANISKHDMVQHILSRSNASSGVLLGFFSDNKTFEMFNPETVQFIDEYEFDLVSANDHTTQQQEQRGTPNDKKFYSYLNVMDTTGSYDLIGGSGLNSYTTRDSEPSIKTIFHGALHSDKAKAKVITGFSYMGRSFSGQGTYNEYEHAINNRIAYIERLNRLSVMINIGQVYDTKIGTGITLNVPTSQSENEFGINEAMSGKYIVLGKNLVMQGNRFYRSLLVHKGDFNKTAVEE